MTPQLIALLLIALLSPQGQKNLLVDWLPVSSAHG